MKENVKTLVLIFSAVLNFTFVGTVIYYKLPFHTTEESDNCPLLSAEINLTKEQLEKFKPMRDKFRARMDKIGRKIKKERLLMIDLIAISRPDRKAIRLQQDKILALQKLTQDTVIDHLLEEITILDGKQRTRFFRIIRERMASKASHRPCWMPSRSR